MLCQNHFNIVGRCYGNAIKKGKYTSLFISIKEKKVLTLLKVVAFGQVGEDLLLMGRDKNTLAIQVYFMVDDVVILTKFKPLDIKNLPKRAIKKVIEEPLPERKGKK